MLDSSQGEEVLLQVTKVPEQSLVFSGRWCIMLQL